MCEAGVAGFRGQGFGAWGLRPRGLGFGGIKRVADWLDLSPVAKSDLNSNTGAIC